MIRRQYLGIVGVGLTGVGAGCSALRGGPTYANDAFTDVTTESGARRQSVSGSFALAQGEIAARSIKPRRSVRLTIEFEATAPIDVILLDQSELDKLRDGEEFLYYQSGSLTDTQGGETSGGLQSGDYAVAFDNSSMGEATPEGDVSGTFRIDVRV
jgi:hypothetical protein